MKQLFYSIVILIAIATGANAQTTVIMREGVTDTGQTLHYVQAFEVRGRWIPIDGLYLDFGSPKANHEILVGGGLQVFKSKRFRLIHEDYLDQASGTKTGAGATYVVSWQRWDMTFVPNRLVSDTVFFTYWPVAGTAKGHTVIDRARVNWNLNATWAVGGGYAGTRFIGQPWTHKPFGNLIYKNKQVGIIEIWLQQIPMADGHHLNLQVRWIRTF